MSSQRDFSEARFLKKQQIYRRKSKEISGTWKFPRFILSSVPAAIFLACFARPLEATDPAFYVASSAPGLTPQSSKADLRPEFRSPVLSKQVYGRYYPDPKLERINFSMQRDGTPLLNSAKLPGPQSTLSQRLAAITPRKEYVFYTASPDLQRFTEGLVRNAPAPHTAVVVMNPKTGEILAMAEKSKSVEDLTRHTGMPAASLFKVITTAAALENSNVQPGSKVFFRGGTYTLQPWNYKADSRRDNRWMTLADALGKSCNPVFARVAQKHLSPELLHSYAERFGFNQKLPFELSLPMSTAFIPEDSDYEFTRTAAGFGDVHISPIHAAVLMSGLANQGLLPRPYILDEVISSDGRILHHAVPEPLMRMVEPETASTLLDLMENTVTTGTSRREFMRGNKPILPIKVVGKTGTLRGQDPAGINNWFIGAAPKQNPEIAIAVVTIYPNQVSTRASRIAKQIIEHYFKTKGAKPKEI